jgi:transcription initiation factor TFIIB
MEAEWAQFQTYLNATKPKTVTTTNLSNPFACKCGGQKVYGENGLPVCTSCGVVDDYYIDDSAEWVNDYSEDGTRTDRSRCGQAQDLELFSEQWGTSCVIKSGKSAKSKRMARIQFHMSMNHRDRALYHAYKSIEEPASLRLHLPESVIRTAKIFYRKFNADILTRGAVRTGIKANCLLYACKMHNVPRTTQDIADAFGIPTKDISRTTDMFRDNILPKTEKKEKAPVSEVTRPADIVHRMLNEFQVENRRFISARCEKMARKLENCVPLMGKTPSSIAAVVVMKTLGELTTKADIVKKCGISMPTLNKIELIVNKHLEE